MATRPKPKPGFGQAYRKVEAREVDQPALSALTAAPAETQLHSTEFAVYSLNPKQS